MERLNPVHPHLKDSLLKLEISKTEQPLFNNLFLNVKLEFQVLLSNSTKPILHWMDVKKKNHKFKPTLVQVHLNYSSFNRVNLLFNLNLTNVLEKEMDLPVRFPTSKVN
jgi:hypothetical protein